MPPPTGNLVSTPGELSAAAGPRVGHAHLRTATHRITESVTEPAQWHLLFTLNGTFALLQLR